MLTLTIAIVGLVISLFTLIELFIKVEKLIFKVAEWVKRQKEQDDELANIRHEQTIITAGVLACLKSLVGEKDEKEVKKAIQMIETHLNEQAHK